MYEYVSLVYLSFFFFLKNLSIYLSFLKDSYMGIPILLMWGYTYLIIKSANVGFLTFHDYIYNKIHTCMNFRKNQMR